MPDEALKFELELKREWADKIEDMHDFVYLVGLTAFRKIVERSPVDEGRFKGNWNASIGVPNATTTELKDVEGTATIARADAAISPYTTLEDFPPVYIVNGLPYAIPLEEGHSRTQAPHGIVNLVVTELQVAFDGAEL